MLDRAKLPDYTQLDSLNVIDDPALLRFNQRALQQHGVFLRVSMLRRSLEDQLDHALTKFVLPSSDRQVALADLDEMTINDTNLFCDLDGAARTVVARLT